MSIRWLIVSVFIGLVGFTAPAAAQPAPHGRDPAAEEAIRALIRELNTAWRQRDRAALERIYADEFVFVHAFGYVDDRAAQIDEMLAAESAGIVPVPSFEPPAHLHVYGDVAVYRAPGKTGLGTPAWTTTIYARRHGRWQIVQRQATELLPERPAVELEPHVLDDYAGRYDRGGGVVTVIEREGSRLVVRHPGYPPRRLTAASAAAFFDKVGATWTFHRGPDGRVTHVVLRRRDGHEVRSDRLE